MVYSHYIMEMERSCSCTYGPRVLHHLRTGLVKGGCWFFKWVFLQIGVSLTLWTYCFCVSVENTIHLWNMQRSLRGCCQDPCLLWAMNPILLSLTYLILVRAIRIPLPPLVHVWEQYVLQELLDLHEVMSSAAIWQDQSARECISVLYLCYNFQSLFCSLQILKNIWHRYVTRTLPLPDEILALGHRLNLRLAGPRLPDFPDAALSQPWLFQCLQLLDSVNATIDDVPGHAAHVEPVSDMAVIEAVVGFFSKKSYFVMNEIVIAGCFCFYGIIVIAFPWISPEWCPKCRFIVGDHWSNIAMWLGTINFWPSGGRVPGCQHTFGFCRGSDVRWRWVCRGRWVGVAKSA